MTSKRAYTLRKRAESQDETRHRIVEATMHLHEEIGPRATTISAIAERAGVQRLTVYRHFPDETAVFQACTTHWLSLHPPPDPAAWSDTEDGLDRARQALNAFYSYYAGTERMWSAAFRDVAEVPALQAPMAEVAAFMPVPGLGVLAVNSFLLKGPEPMLVDTGLAALAEPFVAALEGEIDLSDLRWIWLSHLDADHTGALEAVLARAPKAQVVTNFLGAGKMGLAGFDVSRAHVLEPGARFEVGGRGLIPLRPPYYDAPETTGFFDPAARVLFAADSFGALLPEPAETAAAIASADLRDGLVAWSSIDAPWLAVADHAALRRALRALQELSPKVVLSGHLPPAEGPIDRLVDFIAEAWTAGAAHTPDPLAAEAVAAALAA